MLGFIDFIMVFWARNFMPWFLPFSQKFVVFFANFCHDFLLSLVSIHSLFWMFLIIFKMLLSSATFFRKIGIQAIFYQVVHHQRLSIRLTSPCCLFAWQCEIKWQGLKQRELKTRHQIADVDIARPDKCSSRSSKGVWALLSRVVPGLVTCHVSRCPPSTIVRSCDVSSCRFCDVRCPHYGPPPWHGSRA